MTGKGFREMALEFAGTEADGEYPQKLPVLDGLRLGESVRCFHVYYIVEAVFPG
jgi:hypothetical protein